VSISLDLLRTFLAVHRAGTITGAAQLLGLAQPTVTAQLRSLETAVGHELFDRLPRGVAPTPAADELARRIAVPLDELELLVRGDGPTAYADIVRLGGPAEFVCERALPALSGLVADGLQLSVTFGFPDGLVDDVATGRIDLAISSRRPRRRGIVAEPLCDEEFALVAAPGWAERIGPVDGPEALQNVPLIAYSAEAPILRRYWRTVFESRLTRAPELVVADLRGVLTAVAAGAGASVLPTYLCEAALADGGLRRLAEPELPPLNTLYLAGRPGTGARATVATVRTCLHAAARDW
jgi:DNA-binding transcriptional LysR family regulator